MTNAGTYTGRAKPDTCDITLHSDSAPEGADAMPNKHNLEEAFKECSK